MPVPKVESYIANDKTNIILTLLYEKNDRCKNASPFFLENFRKRTKGFEIHHPSQHFLTSKSWLPGTANRQATMMVNLT
jgi:hypothetical protein